MFVKFCPRRSGEKCYRSRQPFVPASCLTSNARGRLNLYRLWRPLALTHFTVVKEQVKLNFLSLALRYGVTVSVLVKVLPLPLAVIDTSVWLNGFVVVRLNCPLVCPVRIVI